MSTWKYWSKWSPRERRMLKGLLVLGLVGFGFLWSGVFAGVDYTFPVDLYQQVGSEPVPVDAFFKDFVQYTVEAPIQIAKSFYTSTTTRQAYPAAWLYVFFLWASFSVLLASFSRYQYVLLLIGLGLIIMNWAFFHFEGMEVFGLTNRLILGVVVLLTVGGAYYVHQYRPDMPYYQRLAFFAGLMLVLFGGIIGGSPHQHPVWFLANNGIWGPAILSAFFILFVSHEPVAGLFVLITTTRAGEKNNLVNFFAISVIYLLNLGMVYLHRIGAVEFNFHIFQPFFLLSVSMVLGFWGYRRWNKEFDELMPFRFSGFATYMGFAMLTLATIGFIHWTGNTSLINCFHYYILFSHLSVGIIFWVYLLSNFIDQMDAGSKAYKTMYRTRRIPVFGIFLIGAIGVSALILRDSVMIWYNFQGGELVQRAEAYKGEDQHETAKLYYDKALGEDPTSYSANVNRAHYSRRENKPSESLSYLSRAERLHPDERIYLAMAHYYKAKEQYYEAITVLKRGLEDFPESGRLLNNLALMYSFTPEPVSDTTFVVFERAKKRAEEEVRATVEANYLASGLELNHFRSDSLPKLNTEYLSYPFYQSNYLALYTARGKRASLTSVPENPDTALQAGEYLQHYHAALNELMGADSLTYHQRLFTWAEDSANAAFAPNLKLAGAIQLYLHHNRSKAFQQMQRLSSQPNLERSVYHNLGAWMMENHSPREAADYWFNNINDQRLKTRFNYAKAVSEYGKLQESLELWKELLATDHPEYAPRARRMIAILTLSGMDTVMKADDHMKYLYLKYNKDLAFPEEMETVWSAIQHPDLRILGATELIDYFLERDSLGGAGKALKKARQFEGGKPYTHQSLAFAAARLSEARGKPAEIRRAANNLEEWGRIAAYASYFRARAAQLEEDTAKAKRHFEKALKATPLYQPTFLHYGAFAQNQLKRPQLAYDVLVEGIRMHDKNPRLRKAYTLQCIEVGLFGFAEDSKETLAETLPPEEMEKFEEVYRQREKAYQANLWGQPSDTLSADSLPQ